MKNINVLISLLIIIILSSCLPLKKLSKVKTAERIDTVYITKSIDYKNYHSSPGRVNDLIHTKLDVRFDFVKEYLFGKATLTFKPYFYPVDSLILDAKGFDLHEVSIINGFKKENLEFSYDSLQIHIKLDKIYTSDEEYTVFIDYTAKPNELEEGGSDAIKSNKGLYFIKHRERGQNISKQVWTQGETESSSCWFPTIDKPNERTTQEIAITIDSSLTTLSNGNLVNVTDHDDGTRTDHWVMKKPHAPYLFMMAIGDFDVVKEMWRDSIEISYYVDPKYGRYAKDIFANTTEMLAFFSKTLGVDYPWSKFAQVVVKDFVSGAMENTTAVVFNDFVQKTSRELIDNSNDDIIAHEMIHHWFGDLVTCESWSNTALNESLATYGQYMWNKYKYGREHADNNINNDLKEYLWFNKQKNEPIIRYYYDDREDMFDALSYNKGGLVLRMLNTYVGDEAFNKSLQLYLNENQYDAAELAHLRLAFEEVTGEDLNWFFEPWFTYAGHPKITINYKYMFNDDSSSCKTEVSILQEISESNVNIYRLPIAIDIYEQRKVERHQVIVDEKLEKFTFTTDSIPNLINVDAEKTLVCEKEDNKSTGQYVYQYFNAPLFVDRKEALSHCFLKQKEDENAQKVIIAALDDHFWNIRRMAIKYLDSSLVSTKKEKIISLALHDPKSQVRVAAITALSDLDDPVLVDVYKQLLNDSSYSVVSEALFFLHQLNHEAGMSAARELEESMNMDLALTIAEIYSDSGIYENYQYFEEKILNISGVYKFLIVNYYLSFLYRMEDSAMINGLNMINDIEFDELPSWYNTYAEKNIKKIREKYTADKALIEKLITTVDNDENKALKTKLEKKNEILNALEELCKKIAKDE